MKNFLWHQLLSSSFFLSHSLGLGLLLAGLVIPGSAQAEYIPPQGSTPRGSTISNSSRGACQTNATPPLIALAPVSHVGRISTTTPTLSWFVAATTPYRMEISFYSITDAGEPEMIYLQETVEEASGVIRRSFPQLAEVLQVGQQYYWQVALACDPNSTTYDESVAARMEVVEPDAGLLASLEAVPAPEKSLIYAEAGYWYDSVREATNTQLRSLLEELATLEPEQQSQFLYQIVAEVNP